MIFQDLKNLTTGKERKVFQLKKVTDAVFVIESEKN
jgi:hypothetical protein